MNKVIIEELDKIVKVVLPESDHERWNNVMRMLSAEPDLKQAAHESLHTLRNYTGTDFQFKKSEPLHEPGTIVTFKLGDLTASIPAYIHARHEYSGRYKYDLIVTVKMPDAWHTTRLYNIEEKWLS